jgi:hypothetical protein
MRIRIHNTSIKYPLSRSHLLLMTTVSRVWRADSGCSFFFLSSSSLRSRSFSFLSRSCTTAAASFNPPPSSSQGFGSGFNQVDPFPHSESGSGSRRAKTTHHRIQSGGSVSAFGIRIRIQEGKNDPPKYKKFRNFMF